MLKMEMARYLFRLINFVNELSNLGLQIAPIANPHLRMYQIAIQEFKVWLECDRLVVARQRFLGTLEVHQRIAAIVVRLGVVWLECDRLVVARQRFRGTLQVLSALPRLLCASAKSGLSAIALS